MHNVVLQRNYGVASASWGHGWVAHVLRPYQVEATRERDQQQQEFE